LPQPEKERKIGKLGAHVPRLGVDDLQSLREGFDFLRLHKKLFFELKYCSGYNTSYFYCKPAEPKALRSVRILLSPQIKKLERWGSG